MSDYNGVIQKAWKDEAFKQRLMSSPNEVLRESGIEVPQGLDIKVVENTSQVRYFVLPMPPGELTDADLDNVAGGLGGIDGASSGYPDQMNPGGQGSGFASTGLYVPPSNTSFDAASGLGPSGSGYKPGGSL